MAVQDRASTSNKDLESIAQARSACRRRAGRRSRFSPNSPRNKSTPSSPPWPTRVTPHAEALARLAVEETGYGVVADKVQKNLFARGRSTSSSGR